MIKDRRSLGTEDVAMILEMRRQAQYLREDGEQAAARVKYGRFAECWTL
jgi:hypothetical protein